MPATAARDALVDLERLVGVVVAMPVDELSDDACERELAGLEPLIRQLRARQTRLVGALTRRRQQAACVASPRDPRAASRAARQVSDDLASGLCWAPGEVKRAQSATRSAQGAQVAGRALDQGKLTDRHLALIAATLQHVVGVERSELECELTEVAAMQDPVAFGRTCRRRLAECDHDAAMDDQQRRHLRRFAKVATTDEGMLQVSAQVTGIDAELVATTLQAYRVADPAGGAVGTSRTPEQATADALVDVCRAALDHRDAPHKHGVRPQVIVTIDYETLLAQSGTVGTPNMGSLPFAEVRRLLVDAGVARILTDPKGVPLEAGEQVRTVPAGLWRALHVRDGGCVAVNCTAPASWCDVAHLDQPFRLGGRLDLKNAALMCRTHHRRFDLGNWRVTWIDDKPQLQPPDRHTKSRADTPDFGRMPTDTGDQTFLAHNMPGPEPPNNSARDGELSGQPPPYGTHPHVEQPVLTSETTGSYRLAHRAAVHR
ncbi:MAG: DUF222 domain-containing protein, partial [Nitriliruptoraceae bacterium]